MAGHPIMMGDRWEMGSEFHWDDSYVATEVQADIERDFGRLFSSARTALLSLARQQGWQGRTIHLPTYFCPEVTESLASVFKISWYRDLPTDDTPHWDTVRVSPGDVVLALNHFGVRPDNVWSKWIAEHLDAIVIEDYSHDPDPSRMRRSSAHYVVSSLRKTLPIPDGASLLSPMGLALPSSLGTSYSSPKLEAMFLKSLYLQGYSVDKNAYRTLQVAGEEHLSADTSLPSTTFTRQVLGSLRLPMMRARRAANVEHLLGSAVLHERSELFRPLFVSWPDEATPFNCILLCKDDSIREQLRRHLIDHRVYPAIHWVQEGPFASADPDASELGNRLLTLPCDFRYGLDDMNRLANILVNFKP